MNMIIARTLLVVHRRSSARKDGWICGIIRFNRESEINEIA